MKKNNLKYFLIFCCCCFVQQVFARHIIGGEMTYKCLGNGDYEIELKVYRDSLGDGADFDSLAAISIYRCGLNQNCFDLNQGSQNVNFGAPLLQERSVEPNELLCLESRPPVVEEGIYRFKLSDFDISLNLSEESYFIVYQRCCRNMGINNIRNADDRGSTYYVELTSEAQQSCNSSPVFNNFPDLVICQNFEMEFDHSATDPDGDSLVYYFEKPLDGGGNNLDRDIYTTCIGARPIPACPPRANQAPFFPELNYTAPLFGETFPLGKSTDGGINTTVSIDSMTGIISGVPNIAGLFVVSVAVEEYRDGELLSIIRRDFQYTVGVCVRNIEAKIVGDVVLGDRAYRSTICQQNNVVFEHASTPADAVGDVRWEFDLDGQNFVSTMDDAIVSFPSTGIYEGTLIVNPGSRNCEDRATVTVNILPETIAEFSFDYDECEPGFVSFINESSTESDGIREISWDFSDGRFYNSDNVDYLFPTSGNLPVSLTVIDVNNCSVTKTDSVPYFPLTPEIFVAPSATLACAPASITFDNLDSLISDEYDITWDFGDGNGSPDVSPTYVYENPGIYTVNLDIKNPFDCRTSREFPGLVEVTPSPIADFSFTPEELNVVDPTADFFDNSIAAVAWDWDFNGDGRSNETNPSFTFPDTGMQVIQLIVTHPNGCTDTTSQIIDIFPSGELYMPNAFTPNGDGQNDIFIPVALLFGSNDYSFTIWNRWGERVFFSDDIHTGWNGTKNNSGKPAAPGVYLYLIEYTDSRGSVRQEKGYATLLR